MNRKVTGHVWLRVDTRTPSWFAKFRLPDDRQVQRRLGPAHRGRGRPLAGHLTRRAAEEALAAILTDARRGTLDAAYAPACVPDVRRRGRRVSIGCKHGAESGSPVQLQQRRTQTRASA